MNLFRIMQSIRGWAQAGKIDFPGAVKYLTDLGVKMDGIVHQALKNVFKEGKARDPDFGNVVKDFPIDDAGIPFNPKTLKSTKEKREFIHPDSDIAKSLMMEKDAEKLVSQMSDVEIELRSNFPKASDDEIKVMLKKRGTSEADKDIAFIQEGIDDLNKAEREADLVSKTEGIENLFDEKLPKVKMGSRMNYEKIADMEGIDVELIRGKTWDEIRGIIAAIRDKADGGRVGFVEGGWADDLTGSGLSIYNSMMSAGHTEQDIQDTLKQLGYWGADATGVETIVNTELDQGGGGGGGIGELDLTYREGAVPRGPTTDFNINPAAQLTGKGRIDPMGGTYDNLAMMGPMDYKTAGYHMSEIPGQEGYEAPSKYFQEPSLMNKGITGIKNFFSGLGTPRVRGTLGTRLSNQPRLPLPAAMASWSMSPFNPSAKNYNENFVDQLNYLEMQDNMIGIDPNTGLHKYGPESVLSGKNVISMFGSNNYETALAKEKERLAGILEKNKDKWDAIKTAKWKATHWDPLIEEQTKAIQTLAEKKAAASRKKSAELYDPNVHGPNNYGLGSDGQQSFDSGQGFGINATTGGPVSNKTGKGRTDYSKGGLATMFTRRR